MHSSKSVERIKPNGRASEQAQQAHKWVADDPTRLTAPKKVSKVRVQASSLFEKSKRATRFLRCSRSTLFWLAGPYSPSPACDVSGNPSRNFAERRVQQVVTAFALAGQSLRKTTGRIYFSKIIIIKISATPSSESFGEETLEIHALRQNRRWQKAARGSACLSIKNSPVSSWTCDHVVWPWPAVDCKSILALFGNDRLPNVDLVDEMLCCPSLSFCKTRKTG